MNNTMETLTKEQRNKIYKAAYERLDEYHGMCHALTCEAARLFHDVLDCGSMMVRSFTPGCAFTLPESYPEWHNKMPKKIYDTENGYWFSESKKGRAKRLNILKQCIEETNP